MIVFSLHILISFIVFGISFFPINTVNFKKSSLNNIVGIYGIAGIVIVGLGMYLGGGESLHAYIYITFIIQLIILALFFLISLLVKKVGFSKIINICSFCLVTISFLLYLYYIILSFIYY